MSENNKPSFVKVTEGDNEIRIDKWFKRNCKDISNILFQKLLRKNAIKINGKKAKKDSVVFTGDEIRVPYVEPQERKEKKKSEPRGSQKQADEIIKDNILFENKDMMAINKPPGIAVQGGNKVNLCIDDLLRFISKERIRLVHRLDKDTSGVLLLAKTPNAAAKLAASFKTKDYTKIYWALVKGVPEPQEGTIKMPLSIEMDGMQERTMLDEKKGKRAITHYRVVDKVSKVLSLVELIPETGRKHQLRVHMTEIGHPIVGDGKYGGKEAFIEGISKKMHLHARSLFHPSILGIKIDVTAPLPRHMKDSFKFFGLDEA